MSPTLIQALHLFHPDAEALIGPLCRSITRTELQHIAMLDAPSFDRHMKTLLAIKKWSIVPTDDWDREAVQLAQWQGPSTFDWSVASDSNKNRTAHRTRLFASAVLLRFAQNDTECRSMGENQAAAALVASALALGGEHLSAVRQVLAAFVQSPAEPEERLCAALGALLAAVAEADRLPGDHIRTVADALIAETDRVAAQIQTNHTDWLLGLTWFDTHHPLWRSLAQHLLATPHKPHPPEAREVLELLGSMLVTR